MTMDLIRDARPPDGASPDRYAARFENFVPVADPHRGPGARPSTMLGTALSQVEGRSAPRDTVNQPGLCRDINGSAPGWFVPGAADATS